MTNTMYHLPMLLLLSPPPSNSPHIFTPLHPHGKATIVSSSIDDFVDEVREKGDLNKLPVINQELGDSWLYGVPADPIKVALFRQARRSLRTAVTAGTVDPEWPQYDSFMRRLMKGPCEHNWGLSTGSACKDCRTNYTKEFGSTWVTDAFAKARVSDAYQRYDCPAGFSPGSARWVEDTNNTNGVCGYGPIEEEWAEQREWMHPLPSWSYTHGWTRDHRYAQQVKDGSARKWNTFVHDLEDTYIAIRAPQRPSVATGMDRITLPLAPVQCGDVRIGFNAEGAINVLQRGATGRAWADDTHTLGAFSYRTYDKSDFDEFAVEWNVRWAARRRCGRRVS